MKGRSLSGYQRKRVWLNDGVGRFTEVAQVVGATDTYDGRAVALADLVEPRRARRHRRQPARPAAASTRTRSQPGRHWIAVRARGHGAATAARSARASSCSGTGRRQVQEVSGGSGFSAQNQRRLHYGLGAAGARRPRRDPLAVGRSADDRAARGRSAAPREGAR